MGSLMDKILHGHLSGILDRIKVKSVLALVEKSTTALFGRSILPKGKGRLLRQCLFYRDSVYSAGDGDTGCCDLDPLTKCMGKIQFCKNPNALRQYLSERGLGWRERKKDEREGTSSRPTKELEPTVDSSPQAVIKYIYRLPQSLLIAIAFVISMLVGTLNYLTGPELPSSVFYLIPISLVTWFTKRWIGVFMSLVSTLSWLIADFILASYSYSTLLYCNATARFCTFLIFTLILAELRRLLDYEKESSGLIS